MLRGAARREFIAIITLDGLIEAALHTHCLAPVCMEMCVCVRDSETISTPYRFISAHTHKHTV